MFWRFYLEGAVAAPFCAGTDRIPDVRVFGAGAEKAYAGGVDDTDMQSE